MQNDGDIKRSLAFYFALALLGAQFIANAAFHIPFNFLFLAITGFIVIAVLFGAGTAVDFIRAVRGSRTVRGSRDEPNGERDA